MTRPSSRPSTISSTTRPASTGVAMARTAVMTLRARKAVSARRCGRAKPAIRRRVADGQPARDRRQTVAAFAQHWIDTTLHASERKQTTKVMYAGVARTHILPSPIGRLTLDRLRPSHVEGWVVELSGKGLAESTVRSAYTILRAVLDTAVRDGALASNPAAVVRRPR